VHSLTSMWLCTVWRPCDCAQFDVHVTVHRDKFLITKPTRCTNFSNLFLEWNSTCFGQSLCPSSGVFHCTHSNGICHTGLLTTCEQDQDGTGFQPVPSWSCSQVVSKPVWHIPLLCVRWETPDDGQRNCPKHIEFYSRNKFEKLVHLVGFVLRKCSVCQAILWNLGEKPPFLLDPEVGSNIILRNVWNYPLIDTELHPTMFESWTMPLWEPQLRSCSIC